MRLLSNECECPKVVFFEGFVRAVFEKQDVIPEFLCA